jgi:hypothetical protein
MRFNWMILGVLLFTGCKGGGGDALLREDLFSLDIGRLEGEIDLYNDIRTRPAQKTSIAMTDGLFYISNASGQKITRYNSYGDLLFMIYNDETNPPLLDIEVMTATDGPQRTRWAVPYPLQSPGAIAVDRNKNLYVSDMLTPDQHRADSAGNILFDSLLLKFDANGMFVNYIGRQGVGGAPFPHIENIFISVDDEVAVVSAAGGSRIVYWFSSKGELLREMTFSNDELPVPENREEALTLLDSISAAPDERIIYIKADYYREEFDETTRTRTGNAADSCSLWAYSVEQNEYIGETAVPFYENVTVIQGRRNSEELFYSLLGILGGREAVFSFPTTEGYAMLLLKTDGSQTARRRGFIKVGIEELEYSDFTVSPNGIISALLSTEWEAKVVWWRTDKLRERRGLPRR